jgi:hypothetical protein
MLMREHVSSVKASMLRVLTERSADNAGKMHATNENVT